MIIRVGGTPIWWADYALRVGWDPVGFQKSVTYGEQRFFMRPARIR
jgi:hypothetical protein